MKHVVFILLIVAVLGCGERPRVEQVALPAEQIEAIKQAIRTTGETNRLDVLFAERWTEERGVRYIIHFRFVEKPELAEGPIFWASQTNGTWSVKWAGSWES